MMETFRQFCGVFKLRIGAAITLCAVAGMAVTPGAPLGPDQIGVLVLAVFLSSASAGAFNQYAERDLDAGIVYINAPTIGAEIQLPFGGVKMSGLGRKEAGGRGGALDMFTKWKVVYRDFSGRLQKAQMD